MLYGTEGKTAVCGVKGVRDVAFNSPLGPIFNQLNAACLRICSRFDTLSEKPETSKTFGTKEKQIPELLNLRPVNMKRMWLGNKTKPKQK